MTFEDWLRQNRDAVVEFDRLRNENHPRAQQEAPEKISAAGSEDDCTSSLPAEAKEGSLQDRFNEGTAVTIMGPIEALEFQAEVGPTLVEPLQRHFFDWHSELQELAEGLSWRKLHETFLDAIQTPILQLLSGHAAIPQATLLNVI